MRPAQIITLSNQKGGSGKTTTAHALGAGLQTRGYKVLFVDLDAQGNLSYALGVDSRALTSLEMLTGTATAEEATLSTAGGYIIPASPALAGAESLITDTGREYRLKEALEPIRNEYDYIIIDTSPALSILTVNAFTASDKLIIPTGADTFSLQGIVGINQSITAVKKYCNPALRIDGILLTRYSSRAVLSRDLATLADQIAGMLDTKVYHSTIRENISIKEAQATRVDIFTYAPKSNGATDYNAFIDEFLEGA